MAPDEVLGLVQRLNVSVEALAALAAMLRIDAEGLDPGSAIRETLETVVGELGLDPRALARLTEEESAVVVGAIRAFFRQAEELMADPGREPGWSYTDPVVLQSQGRISMLVAPLLAGVAPSHGDLFDRLNAPGAAFLDVGTGAGWLAIAMCREFPGMRAVGIDTWEPALGLAARNAAETGLSGRIELRRQSVTDLEDRDVFDVAWVPGPFLPERVMGPALARTERSLRPGGWVVLGLYAAPVDPPARSLSDLRVIRSGGHPWTGSEACELLDAAGFECVADVERTWNAPIHFVLGRRG